jgi:hypothetical protein
MKIFSAFYGKTVLLSCSVTLVWFVWATWFVRRRVFENRVLRKLFGPRAQDVTNCAICAAYRVTLGLPSKDNKIGRACDMYEEKRNACMVLVAKTKSVPIRLLVFFRPTK